MIKPESFIVDALYIQYLLWYLNSRSQSLSVVKTRVGGIHFDQLD
jgi:hypothetical protein